MNDLIKTIMPCVEGDRSNYQGLTTTIASPNTGHDIYSVVRIVSLK